jgi:hypothetical protein
VISWGGKWTFASKNLVIHMFMSFVIAIFQFVILCFPIQ